MVQNSIPSGILMVFKKTDHFIPNKITISDPAESPVEKICFFYGCGSKNMQIVPKVLYLFPYTNLLESICSRYQLEISLDDPS